MQAGPEARKTQRCSEDWSGEVEVKKKTDSSTYSALGIYTGRISGCCPLIVSRCHTRFQLQFLGAHPGALRHVSRLSDVSDVQNELKKRWGQPPPMCHCYVDSALF